MPKRDNDDQQGRSTSGSRSQRIDKWLWFARVVKTRTLAAGLVQDGRVRVNRERTTKPSHTVQPGDVVTLTVHRKVRILRVVEPGVRRGPATEAATLFEDLTPPVVPAGGVDGTSPGGDTAALQGGGERPTKRDRRAIDRLRQSDD